MIRSALLSLVFAVAVVALPPDFRPGLTASPESAQDDFTPLFNGKDLTGWVNVNCAPGTFFVKDKTIITTGNPTGFLRTERHYENFILEFDWMHVEKERMANSGLFVWGDPIPAIGTPYTRGIEVQVLINFAPKDGWATSHGDIFSIWGAKCTPDRPHPKGIERCLPSENRVKGGGEWNHYKVIANDGAIKLHVNGKEVSGVSKCKPRKGYLALESEGAECHFKNITIKELPSTNPKPEEVAQVDSGYKSLFTGLDLSGWESDVPTWKVSGGRLVSAGERDLNSAKKYNSGDLIFDWKLPAKSNGKMHMSIGPVALMILPDGKVSGVVIGAKEQNYQGETKALKPGGWNRVELNYDGQRTIIRINGEKVIDFPGEGQLTSNISFVRSDGLELMNIFGKNLK